MVTTDSEVVNQLSLNGTRTKVERSYMLLFRHPPFGLEYDLVATVVTVQCISGFSKISGYT